MKNVTTTVLSLTMLRSISRVMLSSMTTGLLGRRGLTLCSWNTKSNLSEGVGGI